MAGTQVSREEVFVGVRDVLVDTLGVGFNEVKEESYLVVDLGAESIDTIDILFRLEERFGICIPRGELFPELDLEFSRNPSFYDETRDFATAEGIAYLRGKHSSLDWSKFEQNPDLRKLGGLVTVRNVVDYVEVKVLRGRNG